ncbi:MAG: hypothetical protein AB2L14_13135 [Candidatus Xenobiia bacterium LiM19]
MAEIIVVSNKKRSYILLGKVKYRSGELFCLILNKLSFITRQLAKRISSEDKLMNDVHEFERKLGLVFSYRLPRRTSLVHCSDSLYFIKAFYVHTMTLINMCFFGEGYCIPKAFFVKEVDGYEPREFNGIGNLVCIVPENEELQKNETYNYEGKAILKVKLSPLSGLGKPVELSSEQKYTYSNPGLLQYNFLNRRYSQYSKYFNGCKEMLRMLVGREIEVLITRGREICFNDFGIYESVFRGKRVYTIDSIDDLINLDLLFLLVEERGLKRCSIMGCNKLFPVNCVFHG